MTARQDVLQEEAAHAVGSLLAGHRIDTVRVGGLDDGFAGRVALDPYDDLDLFAHLIAVLMGPLSVGQRPPAWPPDPSAAAGSDERELAMCVHVGGFDRAQYGAAVAIAAHYVDDPHVKGAVAAVAHKLGQLGALTHVGVKDACGPEFMRFVEAGL